MKTCCKGEVEVKNWFQSLNIDTILIVEMLLKLTLTNILNQLLVAEYKQIHNELRPINDKNRIESTKNVKYSQILSYQFELPHELKSFQFPPTVLNSCS